MIKLKIEGKVTVVFFREKDEQNIVAYCPVLDLSTCGNTIEKAKQNFIECLKIYLEETIKHGTLERDLLKLGWKPNVVNLTIVPPLQDKCRSIPLHILRKEEIRIPLIPK